MIISSPTDYRLAAKARLPRFLFDYIDGGSGSETTLRANEADLKRISLRQRVMRDMSDVSLKTTLLDQPLDLPLLLGPVGLTGMYARRGEVQAAKAAKAKNIPYILSTVSVCSLTEVINCVGQPVWFQLYVLKDRGFMRHALEKAQCLGVTNLVFTVDMPVPGARYRDKHSGMSGDLSALKRIIQAVTKPHWALDVGLMGTPHDLGNISDYRGKITPLKDYIGWIGDNFDPGLNWSDLEWVRQMWKGKIIIKGILDSNDARDALRFGADAIVVSNHGGRQLDGAISSAKALPAIADAVGDDLTILADSGVRTGLDVVRMLALGANGVLLGRAYIYALATGGEAAVKTLLDIVAAEMKVAMILSGCKNLKNLKEIVLI